jgi:CopG family transcriptional regulator/antitoxin EndoAI
MKSSTVNISFNDELLKRIDQLAQQEARSRSELIREAARAYIARKNRWNHIFDFADKQAKKRNVREKDVAEEIANHRSTPRKR